MNRDYLFWLTEQFTKTRSASCLSTTRLSLSHFDLPYAVRAVCQLTELRVNSGKLSQPYVFFYTFRPLVLHPVKTGRFVSD